MPVELVVGPAVAVEHSAIDFETEQSLAAGESAGWAVEAATREVVGVVVVLAFVVLGGHSGAEGAAVVAVVAAAAAVAEVALEISVAAEAVEVVKAVALDPGLQQQKGFATDSSSEPGAAVVQEAGCFEGRSGVKPGTRRAALPCVGP